MPDQEVTNWDVFKDRTESLLRRWDKFAKANPTEAQKSIKGFLAEVNDGYTTALLKDLFK